MAVTYGFFNSVEHDRLYNADQMSTYFKGLVSNGVYNNIGGKMQVKAGSGMTIQVLSGRAIVGDYLKWIENDNALELTLTPAHVTFNRYTAIVIECSMVDREITIKAVDGANATTPTKPPIVRNNNVYQLCLAYIFVPASATAITQDRIQDTRADNSLCGWVTGLIHQVDTSTLFAQWTAAYDMVIAQMQNITLELDRIRSFLAVAPLTCLTAHNLTVAAGSVINIPMVEYTYNSNDIFYLYVNGLKVPVDQYSVSRAGDNLVVTFSGATAPAAGVIYDDVEIEVWRPE